MTEDIRRDSERTGTTDRESHVDPDAGYGEEPAGRRDPDAGYGEEPAGRRDPDAGYGEEPAGRRDPDAGYGEEPAGRRDPDAGYADDRDTHRDPTSQRRPAAGPGTTTSWSGDGLLDADDRGAYQKRWDDIQVRFIDEPRQCVREADDLVGEVTSRISDRFSSARQDMEQRWDGGDEPTTEELRQAVQRYRDFFQRLVAQ